MCKSGLPTVLFVLNKDEGLLIEKFILQGTGNTADQPLFQLSCKAIRIDDVDIATKGLDVISVNGFRIQVLNVFEIGEKRIDLRNII